MAIAGLVPRAAKRLVGAEAEARARVIVAALLGLGAAAAARPWSPWQLTILVGWDVGAGVFLAAVWWIIARADNRATATLATREDETRTGASLLLLGASTFSLVGVALALIEAKAAGGTVEAVLTAVATLTVVLSWAVVHTVFTLRYAHLYFQAPRGGVDFPKTSAPDYHDFAYLAFTIGMTFQVSDTALEGAKLRHTALRHALLSYMFGTVIVATTINVIAGLLG